MEEDRRIWTIVTVLVSFLVVVVVVQSVVISVMYGKLDQATAKSEQGPPAGVKENVAPVQPHVSPKQIPPDDGMDPFDWTAKDWDPFKEMHSMHDRINQMFGSAFNRFQLSDDFDKSFGDYAFSPDMNIEDQGDHFLVTMDLPGSENSTIDIKVENQTLKVSGTLQSEQKKRDKGLMLRQERRSGNFHRSVTLPSPVKADKISTTSDKGVLRITIPKETETSK